MALNSKVWISKEDLNNYFSLHNNSLSYFLIIYIIIEKYYLVLRDTKQR